ncbi:MAG TPA: hypothetical protein VFB80_11480 [Pirellulaceae bacterium]|nr:hypothetical protein [Pirellulaceae bacterium]
MRMFLASLIAVALMGRGPLAAQDADLFNKLDANKDGAISLDEVPAEHAAKFAQLLKIAGKETEKKISLPLFQAALKQVQAAERAASQPAAAAPGPAVDADALFAKLDANKDGFVTNEEVEGGQKSLFDRLVRNADRNSDKQLSLAEFKAGLAPDDSPRQPLAGGGFPGRPGGGAPQANPRQFFDRLDANKDGKLSKEELPERMREGLARLDADGDGSISPDELARSVGRAGAPGTPAPPQLAEQFDRLDANKDGKLTKDEVPEDRRLMRSIFDRADAAGVTKEQFLRAMAAVAPPGPPQRRPDGSPMPPIDALRPALAAIDANRDGELSKEEIEGAAKALLALDKNGDGKLTRDELAPAPGPGRDRRPENR